MHGQQAVSPKREGLPRQQLSKMSTPNQPDPNFSTIRDEREKMSEIRRKYDTEFKKNAVKLSYASTKTVTEAARNLGISDGMLYRWWQKVYA
ncbi:MAG: transposase [Flexilinea sp.]